MKIIISLLFLFNIANAKTLTPKGVVSKEHKRIEGIVTKIFYDELYKKTKHLKPENEVVKAKISPNDGRRGKMVVELLKQKNREKIARLRGLDPSKATSGKAITSQLLEKNRELIKAKKNWIKQATAEMKHLKKKVLVDQKGWKKIHKKTLKQWEIDYKNYVGKIENYKNGLTEIPTILPLSKKEVKKPVAVKISKEHFIVAGSLNFEIRDQGVRPTCSSFAGIRAIETLMSQNNSYKDLSEQYFYWASKPKCQSSPCSKKGSWVGHGLEHSKESIRLNIPYESSCPYQNSNLSGNDTQIPLKNNCNVGSVKVQRFEYVKTLDNVLASLKSNNAVIAGFKLSPNFYKTRGLVLDKEATGKSNDIHASGHAILIIGYMKLPKILNEGKVCFITANSWGTGWGHGGHACLSEKWVINHRNSNPFVVINSLEL